MAKRKEEPIPDDLLAMSLEQLCAEDDRDKSEEFHRLVQARDKAQAELDVFAQRKRDIQRALLAKLKSAKAKS